jgi:hypothetical protein
MVYQAAIVVDVACLLYLYKISDTQMNFSLIYASSHAA